MSAKKRSNSRTERFFMNTSMLYKDACPELARHLMQRHQMNAPALPETVLCPFCFQWRLPDACHVRLRPKRRPSAQVRKLLRKKAARRRLSANETKVLQRFKKASNVLMATCHACNKTSRQVGVNRAFLATLSKTHYTPVSASKHRTPQSANKPTPKSGIHDKTPGRTPTSSSKSGSGKRSVFSRLRKLLKLEESQKRAPTERVKDFLISL